MIVTASLVAIPFFLILRKKQERIAELQLAIYRNTLDDCKKSVRESRSIITAALLVVKYRESVSEQFYNQHSLFPDIYERIKMLINGAKTFPELLAILGDRKKLVEKESIDCGIWNHVYHDTRNHIQAVIEQTLSNEPAQQDIIDITDLLQLGIVTSDSIKTMLQLRKKVTQSVITPQ